MLTSDPARQMWPIHGEWQGQANRPVAIHWLCRRPISIVTIVIHFTTDANEFANEKCQKTNTLIFGWQVKDNDYASEQYKLLIWEDKYMTQVVSCLENSK